jgi:hypothetical protein
LQEIPQKGAGSSITPSRGVGATDKPAIVISVNGRDEPVVRKVTSSISLSGVSSSDIPL